VIIGTGRQIHTGHTNLGSDFDPIGTSERIFIRNFGSDADADQSKSVRIPPAAGLHRRSGIANGQYPYRRQIRSFRRIGPDATVPGARACSGLGTNSGAQGQLMLIPARRGFAVIRLRGKMPRRRSRTNTGLGPPETCARRVEQEFTHHIASRTVAAWKEKFNGD